MNKRYNILVTKDWLNGEGVDLLGAFTSLEALEKFRNRLNKTYKEWDITYVMGYPVEWIKADYNLDDFDLIMHD